MPEPGRKTITISETAHAKLKSMMGNSREISGSLENLIEWVHSQDADIRAMLFDKMTLNTQLAILQVVQDRMISRMEEDLMLIRPATREQIEASAEAMGITPQAYIDTLLDASDHLPADLWPTRNKALPSPKTPKRLR